jgi:hypothetical protein
VLLRSSRPKALDEHVGLVCEAEHDLASPVGGEVERERALAGVRGEEQRPLAVDERGAPGARVVAGDGLDLDDVGAERGEQLGRRRAGDGCRDVDDAFAGQGDQRGCSHTTWGP